MVSRMVTFNGAEYVMPRSSHSATSYFNCRPTGSPHLLQKSGVLALYVPHLVQSTSPRWNGSVRTVEPQLRQVVRRWFSPFRWPHLHSQLPIANSTKSSCDTLRKSVIGNTDWNTACKPESSRSLGSESICRKRSYERFCTSIRFGIWMVAGILEKSKRFLLAVFCCAMYKAPNQCRSGSLAWPRKPSAVAEWCDADIRVTRLLVLPKKRTLCGSSCAKTRARPQRQNSPQAPSEALSNP